jgi:hypothetical protein
MLYCLLTDEPYHPVKMPMKISMRFGFIDLSCRPYTESMDGIGVGCYLELPVY